MGASVCGKQQISTNELIDYQYDLFVIGGGSGGMAAASAAASYKAKVGLADFVKPSPQGTKWGLGGTCVNVGCIPKKLYHYASLLGESATDIHAAGWKTNPKPSHNWSELQTKITDYIKSLNFKYRTKLQSQKVIYYNKLARLKSKHQVQLIAQDGSAQTISARNILIATGGRPAIPDIPGKEHCITSDDIFWKKGGPGKTLIVGASYIALQCGGFIHGLGYDVTIMVRSILLRGFDQHIAEKVGKYMENLGIKFINKAVPVSIILTSQNKKIVTFKCEGKERKEQFDTVLFAVGRQADSKNLNLEAIGVQIAKNGKIIAKQDDKTSIDNIYSIGDVCFGRLELTPTAIMAGKLLAQRLFNRGKRLMAYHYVPTTVFTPLEYGCCGFSEEQAKERFGQQNIVAYGSAYRPLEWSLKQQNTQCIYAKIVVNKNENNKILGMHYLGPNAGQVIQGFAVGILKGLTKQDLDYSVGIHPTMAEQFTLLQAIANTPEQVKQYC